MKENFISQWKRRRAGKRRRQRAEEIKNRTRMFYDFCQKSSELAKRDLLMAGDDRFCLIGALMHYDALILIDNHISKHYMVGVKADPVKRFLQATAETNVESGVKKKIKHFLVSEKRWYRNMQLVRRLPFMSVFFKNTLLSLSMNSLARIEVAFEENTKPTGDPSVGLKSAFLVAVKEYRMNDLHYMSAAHQYLD